MEFLDAFREKGRRVVPLFPLPGLFLFPATALRLRIFEPRYRQMIEDLLDRSGRFVLGTVLPGHEKEVMGNPPIHSMGGLGEILRHEKLDDGQFDIVVLGIQRVQITEVESDRLYRKVQIDPLKERAPDAALERELRPELLAAIRSRSPIEVDLPQEIPVGQLTDLLLVQLKDLLPHSIMLDLFSDTEVSRRTRCALREHARQPIPVFDDDHEPGFEAGFGQDLGPGQY